MMASHYSTHLDWVALFLTTTTTRRNTNVAPATPTIIPMMIPTIQPTGEDPCTALLIVVAVVVSSCTFWHCGILLPRSSLLSDMQHVYISGSSPLIVAVYIPSSDSASCSEPLKEIVSLEELLQVIVNEVELEFGWRDQDAWTVVREMDVMFSPWGPAVWPVVWQEY